MKTIKEWLLDKYEMDCIDDIVNYGMVSDFNGLSYYHETVSFYDEHEAEIWNILDCVAEDKGLTVMEIIASYSDKKNISCMDQFKTLLTWYAVERVANIINCEYD